MAPLSAEKKKMLQEKQQELKANKGKELEILVDGEPYVRLPVKTPLITENDKLPDLVKKYIAPHIQAGDIVFISEKVVAVLQNRIILIRDIKPSPLARFLAKRVQNYRNTKKFKGFGHGTSMAMQLFIEEAGYPRVLFAAAVSAVTRPLGIKGLFYMICGKRAKSIDCPMSFVIMPYLHYAKLAPLEPDKVARDVRDMLQSEVAIVDANYQGVFSLGKSSNAITETFIQKIFRDNPLGQADEMTPFCVIRKVPAAA